MIELHPEPGWTVHVFAFHLCWTAKRIRKFQNHAYGYFDGTLLVALEDTHPYEVVKDYHSKRHQEQRHFGGFV